MTSPGATGSRTNSEACIWPKRHWHALLLIGNGSRTQRISFQFPRSRRAEEKFSAGLQRTRAEGASSSSCCEKR
ncbi:hypothetical protein Mapa_017454 [Marchantia paleacea]|nr:hypothetical protein Mapa_017454 [Marchantia paleacea]